MNLHRFSRLVSFALLSLPILLCAQPLSVKILDHKDRIRITKVDILNSSYRETNLSITPDGEYLYFMSMRGGKYWSNSYMVYKGDSVYDGDIWFSRKLNNEWQPPQTMPFGINTANGQDEPNISSDGNTVYYQSWQGVLGINDGPYYKARRVGSTWGTPMGLGGGITEFFRIFYATDGMGISPDERTFIVAAGREYDEPMDLYISKLTTYGWTYCRRLAISTPGNERSAFIAADGKSIYFASDGYQGFGGLDIFKATLFEDGSVGNVINVGEPFNTSGDDYGFILTADGSEAYFIRDGDIHFADLTDAQEEIKPEKPQVTLTLHGTVKDSLTLKGLSAEIILLDARTKRLVKKVRSNYFGVYAIDLPNDDRVYEELVVCEGYPRKKRRVSIKSSYQDESYQESFLLARPRLYARPKPKPAPEPIVKQSKPTTDPPVDKKETPTPPKKEPVSPPVASKPVPKPTPKPTPKPDPEIEAMKKALEEEEKYSFEGYADNNLVLLLDVSASMRQRNKLPLLKKSFLKLLKYLRTEDLITVIVYSGKTEVLLEGVSAAQKELIAQKIGDLKSGGATKSKTALKKAYRLLEEYQISSGNNRIILATDGYFEVDKLYGLVQENESNDFALSIFAFGDMNAGSRASLQKLAGQGKGNYVRIRPDNVETALLKELQVPLKRK